MRTALRVAACAFAFASALAFADGVPLIVPAPALKAGDPAQRFKTDDIRGFVKMHPIIFAAGSFGANVLTVTIDSKEYRFVGSMLPPRPPAPKNAPPQPKFATWYGKEPGGATMGITKNLDDGDIGVNIEMPPSRRFYLVKPGGSTVLIETDSNVYTPPTLVSEPAASGVRR